MPISITTKPQALAIVSRWLTERPRAKGQRIKEEQTASDSTAPSALSPYPLALSPKIITTPNPEMVVAAQTDPEFLKALQEADLAIPDGIGIVWSLRLLGLKAKGQRPKESFPVSPLALSPYPLALSRLSGLDLMESLIAEAAKSGRKVLLLGGKPGIAAKATATLLRTFTIQDSAFRIKSLSGPPNIETASLHELNELNEQINQFSPDLLFVAFGHGRQEKWLATNRHRLHAGVAMGVGGAFDQIADPTLRPPRLINSIGLGWLYRLLRQPWRWRRQLALLKFVGMVVRGMKNLK